MKTVFLLLCSYVLALGFAPGTPLLRAGLPPAPGPLPSRMVRIPAGTYEPFSVGPRDAKQEQVAAFLLDEYPVTNAEFLAFVQANPKWRRSQVSRLFADSSYLKYWTGDLEPGLSAPPDSPVVQISWFAARAYAHWVGKRLPTTAEWELAAGAGYTQSNGKDDPQLKLELYAWFARPVPQVLPAVTSTRSNYYGVHGLNCLVWEWVEDFNSALITSLNPNLLCAAGATEVKDTGDYAAFMRRALRSSLQANNTTSALGFRCARNAASQAESIP